MKYCLPLLCLSLEEATSSIEQSPHYELYELWCDYLDEWDHAAIVSFAKRYPEKLIAVFRRLNLDSPKRRFEERTELQKELAELPIWIDFDINTQTEEIESFPRKSARLLTSYHNYERTPGREELERLYGVMDEYNPETVKFATFCERERDALHLLEFLLDIRGRGPKVVVLGMGEYGLPVRIFGAEWGNAIGFAPEEVAQASAPGQLTLRELQSIESVLKRARDAG